MDALLAVFVGIWGASKWQQDVQGVVLELRRHADDIAVLVSTVGNMSSLVRSPESELEPKLEPDTGFLDTIPLQSSSSIPFRGLGDMSLGTGPEVEDPCALVFKKASFNTLLGFTEPFFVACSCTEKIALFISSLEYLPASIPFWDQLPTPSSTPIVCPSSQMKQASSPRGFSLFFG
ncbi:hypothetical protein ACH5RR_007192 [Cinchona calisaya]|uniref:Uncharacterized protein n=1 Tax=Cinchona calisaya TaxID=153742 RepID=A0ABD3AR44_9GENT